LLKDHDDDYRAFEHRSVAGTERRARKTRSRQMRRRHSSLESAVAEEAAKHPDRPVEVFAGDEIGSV
jgi:hypothetical protein